MNLPDIHDIQDAAARLKGIVTTTPLLRNDKLDELVGAPVYVKCEPLQVTGSFKIRGAYNRLCRLSAEEREKGVVAFSSGNHAQGVARAARLLGMPAVIVMPEDTPAIKIDGVKADGADIVFYDRFSESRELIAESLTKKLGAVLVPSFDDFHIIAGQGTCGLEIAEQWPLETPPAQLVCCVGGGGLISGVSLAVRNAFPDIEIFGAEPADFDDFDRSLKAGERLGNPAGARSICDALLSERPGEMTFEIAREQLTGIGRISDDDARDAVRFAFRNLKIVAEPGGAAALAAVLAGRIPVSDGPIVVVLTGGNIDARLMSDILAV